VAALETVVSLNHPDSANGEWLSVNGSKAALVEKGRDFTTRMPSDNPFSLE
jgi:hypothetical protein